MRTIRLPQLQNVAPNSHVSLALPLGVTYEKLYFTLGTNITTALITNIVLRINNKEFQRWATAADLVNGLSLFKGNFNDTSTLVLDFTERDAKEEVAMKLGTIAATAEAGVQNLTLEFDLGNYTNVAASIITGWADVELPSANSIVQRVQYSQKVIAAAAQEQIYLPFGANGYQLKRLILKHTNLASVRVRRDGVDIYEDLPVAFQNKRLQDFKRAPQAGYQVIDFMPDCLQSNALNTALVVGGDGKPSPVTNLDIRLTTSAADTITIYAEAYSLNAQL
ncbi:major capsid protein P2 [Piscinibacter sp.]|uniref:major capsid protein P2 n=1 Tax=Piscinibacter sp. TaxID=1903157 RepID=UPI0039E5BEF2